MFLTTVHLSVKISAMMDLTHEISRIINHTRYPIRDTDSFAYQLLVATLRDELRQQQYCVLTDFLNIDTIATAVEEVSDVEAAGYRNLSHRNCYLARHRDPALPATHPANIFFDASYTMIAADLLSATSPLKQLYYSHPMINFVSQVTESSALYVSEDPYQPVNILCSADGDQSAWHFDSWNAFTMTLMLQAPESGGVFELVPNIRSKENPNDDELSKVLLGDRSRVKQISREPGALVIFRGSTSLHRVTKVVGARQRLMAVFVYETAPGVVGDSEVNATVYGPRVVGD